MLRALNALFTLLFTFAVAVQWNDPDPLGWMAMYGAAAFACVAWELRRLPRPAAIGLGVVAGGWAVWSALATHLSAPMGEALTDWQMHTGGSEELRETLGLVIVAGWAAVLAVVRR